MNGAQRKSHGPAGVQAALRWEEVAEHRNLNCGLYNVCLELAVIRKWSSFSCTGCDLWEGTVRRRERPAQVLTLPMLARG